MINDKVKPLADFLQGVLFYHLSTNGSMFNLQTSKFKLQYYFLCKFYWFLISINTIQLMIEP